MRHVSKRNRADVESLVRTTILSFLPGVPPEEITGHKHLKDLGADSVDRVEIIMTLLDRLAVSEPMSTFSRIPSIDVLVDVLCQVGRA